MRRDRLTFAMIVGIPIIQLVLFGYAINTDPKNLPTAVIVADRGRWRAPSSPACRSPAISASTPARHRSARRARMLADGDVSRSSSRSRGISTRDLVRGASPQILIEADATDPAASANAIAAMPEIVTARGRGSDPTARSPRLAGRHAGRCRRAPALQSGRDHRLQHRAGADRHHPHHDDDADDGAGADARDRARHDGEPSRHAGRGRSTSWSARSCPISASASCRWRSSSSPPSCSSRCRWRAR